jgi:LPS export ABC transporter protein LptC
MRFVFTSGAPDDIKLPRADIQSTQRNRRITTCDELWMKFNKKKGIILGFTLLVISVAITFLAINFYKASPETVLKVMADNVDLQVKNVIYTDVGQSGEKWEIRADTARYAKKENLAFFDTVRVKLVTNEGKTFVMTGERAKLQTDTKNIEISGNVEILSDRGDRFRTDILRYNNTDSTVHTDGAVTMWGDQMQIRGTGMTLNLKQGQLSLQSKVKGQIQGK